MASTPSAGEPRTLDEEQIEDIAEKLVLARRARGVITSDAAPHCLEDVYAIQRAVCARSKPVGAWKMGRAQGRAAPIFAPIFASDLFESPATIPAGRFRLIGIEAEVAFRLGRDLPHRLGGYSLDDVVDAIDAMLPVIEIVDSRLQDHDNAGPLWKLADNQVNGGLVTGTPITEWRDLDPGRQPVKLWVDGEEAAHSPGINPAGPPLDLVHDLANHVGDHCGGLVAGQVLITGSLTGILFVEPGARVEAVFDNLGTVGITTER